MITQDSIEALKTRLDIVDVVGSYIELKKSGVNFKAICPFHSEKTPSFVVSPSKQIYHCFSCGSGGDSIKFVMEIEKLSYPEAIEKLASSHNFTLSYSDVKKQKPKSSILEQINGYYKTILSSNSAALSYLKSRGVYESSIEKFELGYAPSSNSTLNFLKSNFLSLDDAIKSGVIGNDNGGYYARFIERIMFPIRGANKTIVGFGGRTMINHPAKYVNSPQTELFDKSKLLYAYHLAKDSIYKSKEIIITEGYLDVIMLHQAGFNNTVATLGTALTTQHLPLLRRGEPRVIVAYDGDIAGVRAAVKASRLLSSGGFNGGVVVFKDSLDPADMVKNGDIVELERLLKTPKPFIEFVLDRIILEHNIDDPLAKEVALKQCVEYLKTLSPFLQEEYRLYVAQKLGAINPLLIKIAAYKNTSVTTQNSTQKMRDNWELMIIKTAIEHPEFISMILDVLDASLIRFHQDEFNLLLSSKLESPELVAISLDDSISSLKSEDELKKELSIFLIKHYEIELKKVNLLKNISFEEKTFLIRKYRNNIASLKKQC